MLYKLIIRDFKENLTIQDVVIDGEWSEETDAKAKRISWSLLKQHKSFKWAILIDFTTGALGDHYSNINGEITRH